MCKNSPAAYTVLPSVARDVDQIAGVGVPIRRCAGHRIERGDVVSRLATDLAENAADVERAPGQRQGVDLAVCGLDARPQVFAPLTMSSAARQMCCSPPICEK